LTLGDLDPQTVKLATGIDLHLPVGVVVEEAGVRIEFLQHAVERTDQEIMLVHRLHIAGPDVAQHAREEREILIARCGSGNPRRRQRENRNAETRAEKERTP